MAMLNASVRLMAAALALSTTTVFAATNVTGAGGTFPAPVYAKWAAEYQKQTGSQVNYQGIGSSGGIKQIIAKTVDFGASDAPMSDDDLAKNGLFQFPTVIGGVVLAVNIPGVKSGELTLDGKTLGDIYLGTVKKWNDPEITKLNPKVKLPDTNINVVRRADGSGTSFVFTSYLSKVNADWASKVGKGSTVNWPVGLGGKGNDGVAAFVQRLPGSIGYVEYAYAKQNNLTWTKLLTPMAKWLSRHSRASATALNGLTGANLSLRISLSRKAKMHGRFRPPPLSWCIKNRMTRRKVPKCLNSSTGLTKTAAPSPAIWITRRCRIPLPLRFALHGKPTYRTLLVSRCSNLAYFLKNKPGALPGFFVISPKLISYATYFYFITLSGK
ncbi:phosphate ABC transporter substrate-binding protein PstS [Kosakonia sp. YIM B13587]|uniref:phosphate ABC transporter substrate-binding protein PstS n=1 Tax=Kosakonia sp. YIM B13587 TaxID=3366288 RepID=UPI00369E1E6C